MLLLVVLFGGSISINVLNKFYEYKKITPSIILTYDKFKFLLKQELKQELIKFTAPYPLSDNKTPLKTFHLSIKQKDLDSLNVNLPLSGKDHYVDAYMKVSDDKKIKKIKLRYRGDQVNHWLFEQKSLRIKLSSDDIYDMHKKFNLINPPMISSMIDVINYDKSKENNLLAPDYYPVRVFLNGNYMGVYFFLSQIDESLLREFKKMPGSIYKGDYSPYNIASKDGVSNLFRDDKAWQKTASRNAEQKHNRDDIQYFIKNINTKSDIEFFNFFNDYLDIEKYNSFFAIDVIFGSNHHDYAHNHFLYFDPYKGKFEPIQWDLRYWTTSTQKDESEYPLLNRVKLNPILEYKRDKKAYELLTSSSFTPQNIIETLDKLNLKIYDDLNSDIYKDDAGTPQAHKIMGNMWYPRTFTTKEYDELFSNFKWLIETRRKNLLKIYDDAKINYTISKSSNYSILKLTSDANSPVFIRTNKKLNIYQDRNFNAILDEGDIKISGDILYAGRKWIDKKIGWRFGQGYKKLVNSPLYYQYIVKEDIHIDNFSFKNCITNNKVIPKQSIVKKYISTSSIHPWQLPKQKQQTKILQGDIKVTQNLIFDKYTNVIIKPDTTFTISPKKSIYFYAKVEAIGTKENPIRFLAKDATKPWGLVAVQGRATTGSKFEYIELENGSLDTKNLIHYTSQFNIHDTDWFEVRNSKIGKNFLGDDAMHVAYAKGIIDNCEFIDARSDALDIDISDVVVTNNIFKNSANDGLDIMTTTMKALNNTFINAGDKGISVGEWSKATISNSTFIRTNIGLEIKDKSSVVASNLTFIDTKSKAINLYNKNKRYDRGGYLEANNLKFIGNSIINADDKSKVIINE